MLILHNKMISPFSEKVRLMLGYSCLKWQSVQAPVVPPRPSLDPILQGYRRIPVAQIGADYFCDTRLIAEEIAQLSACPELSPLQLNQEQLTLSERIDSEHFLHCVNTLSAWPVIRKVFREVPIRDIWAYLKDKKHLRDHASPEAIKLISSRAESLQNWTEHLEHLEQIIKGPFILGEQPSYLDFCAYHMIWFRESIHANEAWSGRPQLKHWFQHMHAIGHGDCSELSAEQAIHAARDQAREVSEHYVHSDLIGQSVSIFSKDILLGPTTGVLVGEDKERWIIAKHTDLVGTIHIHFSKFSCNLTREPC
ncbi:glutathione S-transferase family protein [Pseudoteredinibacter isoporae]|uniref:Glutathione S-transferase n=1 Tax=Pseudoteredinibacter isoporae TaxID=570281 RepID=A0A7X0MWH4_9GAMM|nr:glutathione S-transferase family protein [Pseudoteredinibacter isoporae]MBB6522180.1 glutathione S-transferase [Pseudoteredinibacter isoporae]NHO87714.1 glutathione S-transferase family protein [Pseudoteredinibacter isoporae]NIB23955.1 glutathione S-transferase family protein [Pseudoteredinibacter isoporae]